MAVVKRRPVPKTGDLQKKEENVERKMPTEPRRPLFEAIEEWRKESEIKKTEEDINKLNEINSIEKNKSYDLEKFEPALSTTKTRSNLMPGVISIINSKCGKRVVLSKDLMNKLNDPNKIVMAFSEESIAIGVSLPNNNNELNINKKNKKGVIYSSGIVSEITSKYALDFKNRTSITFSKVDYIEAYECTIAIIHIK